MQNFSLETHIGADGILRLDLPVTVKNMDLKVTVTCLPLSSAQQKHPKHSVWDAIQAFRKQLEPGDLEPDEDIFADVRDRSPGRELIF